VRGVNNWANSQHNECVIKPIKELVPTSISQFKSSLLSFFLNGVFVLDKKSELKCCAEIRSGSWRKLSKNLKLGAKPKRRRLLEL
jgi:hypothetical protein